MATPNYAFEKRRRELDKKAKKEEKRKQKLEAAGERDKESSEDSSAPSIGDVSALDAPPA
ncbi:MAG: hypothetical protein WCL19_02265 [Verrucomicrobiota bacterium]|jgi:hypothetical protein